MDCDTEYGSLEVAFDWWLENHDNYNYTSHYVRLDTVGGKVRPRGDDCPTVLICRGWESCVSQGQLKGVLFSFMILKGRHVLNYSSILLDDGCDGYAIKSMRHKCMQVPQVIIKLIVKYEDENRLLLKIQIIKTRHLKQNIETNDDKFSIFIK